MFHRSVFIGLQADLIHFPDLVLSAPTGRLLVDMLGFKTIEQLIADQSKIMVFKSLHDLAPPYLCDFFTRNSNSSSYVPRNTATDLKLHKKESCNGQRCFSYRGAKMWNGLPEKTKQASSLLQKNI